MFLRTELLEQKKFIGFSTKTSLANDQTANVWRQLMPRLKEVKNLISSDLISLQVYDYDYFDNFLPTTVFTKYALIEVKNYDLIPANFEKFDLPAGNYAVFLHKGTSAEFPKTAQYIYAEWLPKSHYKLDDRPHFEVLGDNYKGHENPENEEEVWIPIK
ncbi:GyrI-like domain-containing protein [uncultured Flavobacterium sp.]|uniref:GyrI-like domain-containing protein n=1 Tax=uncultured Flavobacterium sp. TaxID=165435 RepID=UPI0030EB692C|tara:strand:+ start:150484 stop:150960 length:477 start_codon:yes stop_codon:yes gene_type:complete